MPSNEFFEGYKRSLVSRLYGLLCEREKGGEWKKYASSLHTELLGFEPESISYYVLLGKMGALSKLDYPEFRKTIFECITLVKAISSQEGDA